MTFGVKSMSPNLCLIPLHHDTVRLHPKDASATCTRCPFRAMASSAFSWNADAWSVTVMEYLQLFLLQIFRMSLQRYSPPR